MILVLKAKQCVNLVKNPQQHEEQKECSMAKKLKLPIGMEDA